MEGFVDVEVRGKLWIQLGQDVKKKIIVYSKVWRVAMNNESTGSRNTIKENTVSENDYRVYMKAYNNVNGYIC